METQSIKIYSLDSAKISICRHFRDNASPEDIIKKAVINSIYELLFLTDSLENAKIQTDSSMTYTAAKVGDGVSACIFIASDWPMDEVSPTQDYPLYINIDEGIIDDSGADDNYCLRRFVDAPLYTDKSYAVSLEWNYTDGRAEHIIEYIKNNLKNTDSVEFWHVWLMGYWEFEDRPFVHRQTLTVDEFSIEHIKALVNAEIWNKPDKMYLERPSFYCMEIVSEG